MKVKLIKVKLERLADRTLKAYHVGPGNWGMIGPGASIALKKTKSVDAARAQLNEMYADSCDRLQVDEP